MYGLSQIIVNRCRAYHNKCGKIGVLITNGREDTPVKILRIPSRAGLFVVWLKVITLEVVEVHCIYKCKPFMEQLLPLVSIFETWSGEP